MRLEMSGRHSCAVFVLKLASVLCVYVRLYIILKCWHCMSLPCAVLCVFMSQESSLCSCADPQPGVDYPNVNWCVTCGDGDGQLLCCDYCPAACHYTCVGITEEEAEKLEKW